MANGFLSTALERTSSPGIAEINALAEELRRKGERLINLGQAIPFYSPPKAALDALEQRLDDPNLHRYTADSGLLPLRRCWSEILRDRFGLRADPEKEMLITSGANGAYLMAVLTILNPKDKMGLISPWYFNHAMAVTMLGGTVVEIALSPENGYDLDPEAILAEAKRQELKALTIVTPNNPTGTTYQPAALRQLAEGLLNAGITLIVDEAYAFFPSPETSHFSPGSIEGVPSKIITIGSFSKTFGLTGWRLGYVVASRQIIEQMLKVQDTMIICASHPAQSLVLSCFSKGWKWLEEQKEELNRRRSHFQAVAPRFHPWRVRSLGLFFAYLEGPYDGRETVFKILNKEKVVLIPGDVFSSGPTKTFRLSLGCAPEQEFLEGIERIARAFNTGI